MSGTPVAHVDLPQAPLPANYAAPITHWHDFPPQAPSCNAHMPEYSTSTIVGYSSDSSDSSDDRHSLSPCRRNTRRCQYTNSPKYDRSMVTTSACHRSDSSDTDRVHRCRHSADTVCTDRHVNDTADNAASNIPDVVLDETALENEVCSPHVIGAIQSPTTPAAPFTVPHLIWKCSVEDRLSSFLPHRPVSALLDHGSPVILIRESLVVSLNLRCHRLHEPFIMDTATPSATSTSALNEWVKIQLHNPSNCWSSSSVRAIVAPSLCTDIILRLLFLTHNNIVVDASARTVVHKPSGFDLLSLPSPVLLLPPPCPTLKQSLLATRSNVKLLCTELNSVCVKRKISVDSSCEPVKSVDVIAAVHLWIECLAAQEELDKLGIKVKEDYAKVFSPLPHIDDMPDKITCKIELVDALKTIASCSYNCPCKFRSAWQTLIQQHLDAGHICPSSSPYASPAFLIPKPDSVVLPRWVNDY